MTVMDEPGLLRVWGYNSASTYPDSDLGGPGFVDSSTEEDDSTRDKHVHLYNKSLSEHSGNSCKYATAFHRLLMWQDFPKEDICFKLT